MSRLVVELKELASINLHFAMAEIDLAGDAHSIARALDHVAQAAACLKILAREITAANETSDEAA